jgi:hypothetical protein
MSRQSDHDSYCCRVVYDAGGYERFGGTYYVLLQVPDYNANITSMQILHFMFEEISHPTFVLFIRPVLHPGKLFSRNCERI